MQIKKIQEIVLTIVLVNMDNKYFKMEYVVWNYIYSFEGQRLGKNNCMEN